MSSCNITKFLDEDELLVDQVKMKIESEEKSLEKSALRDELERFYILKPNRDFRSRNYFKYKDKEDLPWIRRWLKNKHSEKPSILDSVLVEKSAVSIENYLNNKKGFHQATVDYEIKEGSNKHSSTIQYIVNTGTRYTINEIHHIAKDTSVAKVLKTIAKKSILKSGDPIDAFAFDLEKQRIVTEFQKNGYADFNLTNVEINGDSTDLVNKWDIFMLVLPPSQSSVHQSFSVGDINIYTDAHQSQLENKLNTEYLFGKYYKHESKDFIVRPSTIDRKIYLSKYDKYDSEKYLKTIRSLFSLGTYRFAKLTPRVNPKDSTLIDYDIYLTPHNNKWSMNTGLEAFYSNISLSTINPNLVGIATSFGLEDKNAFGGSEIFKTSLEAGLEVNPANLERSTLALGFFNNVEIPTLTKPFNILRPLRRFGFIKENKYQRLQEDGKSRISLGFNYIDNINLYRVFTVEAGYGYEFVLNSRKRFTFNQIGLNYTRYEIPPVGPFNAILDRNPVLRNSFQNSLFTGFLFNDLTYYYQSQRGVDKSNIALISRLELSGLEVFALNSIYNQLFNKSENWTIDNIEFERLAKLELDFRWYQRAKRRTQLAARVKAGIAVPLDKNKPVSYIKQFSIGGPSSVRAWRPMHVGPGTYVHDGPAFFQPDKDSIFYQRGDLILEANLEYRFDLIWLMEGAVFMDAGNIWTLREDPLRPGAKFDLNFLSNIAIGYGYGIRFDFNYFIIRFDLGFKLRYPSITDPTTNRPYVNQDGEPVVKSRWTGPNWGNSKSQKFGNFNIAVNYPF